MDAYLGIGPVKHGLPTEERALLPTSKAGPSSGHKGMPVLLLERSPEGHALPAMHLGTEDSLNRPGCDGRTHGDSPPCVRLPALISLL